MKMERQKTSDVDGETGKHQMKMERQEKKIKEP